MRFLYIFIVSVLATSNLCSQSFGIGTDAPNPNSILDVSSTSKGVLVPRLTTAQRNSNLGSLTTADEGLLIYNISDNEFNYWDGTAWISFPGGSGGNDIDWDNIGDVLSPSDGVSENVAIGTSTSAGKLTVEDLTNNDVPGMVINRNSQTADVAAMRINTDFRNGSSIETLYNSSAFSGEYRALFNEFDGTAQNNKVGVKNHFKPGGRGIMTGMQNIFESDHTSSYQYNYGLDNQFNTSGDVRKYGVRNYFHPDNIGTAVGIETQIYSTDNTRGKSGNTVLFHENSGGNQDGSFIVINSTNTTGPTGGLRKRAYACSFGSNAGGTLVGLDVNLNVANSSTKYGARIQLPINGTLSGTNHGLNVSAGENDHNYAAYFIGRQYISYKLGIASFNPYYRLQMGYNSAAKPSSSSWIVSSDARLKKDVKPFEDGLELVKQINPVWFTYNGKAEMPEETAVGTIAQELQKIAPYMVGTWEYTDTTTKETTKYLDVDYGALDFVLVNAIQEQQEVIEKLVNQNESLEAAIRQLVLRIEHLEN